MEKKRDYTNQDVLVLIESELIDRKNQVSKISLKVQSNIYESLFYYIRLTREQGTEFVKFLNTVVGDNQNNVAQMKQRTDQSFQHPVIPLKKRPEQIIIMHGNGDRTSGGVKGCESVGNGDSCVAFLHFCSSL